MPNVNRLKTKIVTAERHLKDLQHQLALAIKPKNPGKWVPYVNESTGCTCDYSAHSDCCDSCIHHGTWGGKSGYMCQKCSQPCQRVSNRY